ncbi:hypothetical protein [Tropicimonas sp.]|uniref:hypothetical protein n=1 Tax=Tropicimonas sp. TaxID=2067044 RepID=UPI003A8B5598
MTLIETIREIVARRTRYNRTVRAIENMPLDVALDLDIHRGDARKIAREAVYAA